MTIPLDRLAASVPAFKPSPPPPPSRPTPATLSADAIVTLSARLRLACAALGCHPSDVRLEDLSATERDRLLAEGRDDFWILINQTPKAPHAH